LRPGHPATNLVSNPRMKARLALAALLLATLLPASAQTAEEWIARARARLGTESALQGVTSIRFTGTIEIDGTDSRAIDIVFQKPLQQRITVTDPKAVEVIGLDDYDGWSKRSNPKNPTQWQLTLLDAPQIKRFRAQTWDNLNFLRGVEKLRGTVKLGGEETVDGAACVKLVFTYYDNIVLTRFYDKATLRLIKTVTESGTEIREEGETFANGIRFPRKISNREKSGKVITMTFDKIVLNEKYPASDFAVPAMPVN
jgi:hypothetical protein